MNNSFIEKTSNAKTDAIRINRPMIIKNEDPIIITANSTTSAASITFNIPALLFKNNDCSAAVSPTKLMPRQMRIMPSATLRNLNHGASRIFALL